MHWSSVEFYNISENVDNVVLLVAPEGGKYFGESLLIDAVFHSVVD